MKQRILFVDDEPNILKGLQRSLRPLRKIWDMTFVDSGEAALDILEKKEFHVIISDMRMPEMDGGQLLRQVQERWPTMVRIILSGHSDQELIMKSVKSAHQYLSKPCEKQTLINAVNRACSLKALMNKKNLQLVISGIDTMPILPSLYSRVMKELRSPEASTAGIGEIIAQDVGMTAKVLQLVNSSFFGMPRHVASPSEAVVLLGIDVVKTLILSIEVFSEYRERTLSIIPVSKVYEHCVRTGVIAKQIARMEKKSKEAQDNAMIAGILHDLGRLLLAENFPEDYKAVMDHIKRTQCQIHEAEAEVLGVTHAEIGGYLLSLWGLPDDIVEGVVYHHHPAACIAEDFSICGVIHVANLMERHERIQPGGWETLPGLDNRYMAKQGLVDRIPMWRDRVRSTM
ncbi:MAG TPA: two-component system response regulator [Desulfobacteraceae bacterium]|nr:two-component system response regulator [Desulfobacteraceae bacterium]